MLFSLILAHFLIQFLNGQQQTNIYGYNYDSNSGSNGLSLVQNPNYQFLNDQLADQYAQTYQQEARQYDQNNNQQPGSISSSSSNVPLVGYYTGSPLSNTQQNQINYQNILQRNPTSNTAASTNIYGYDYSSTGTSGNTGASTYNNQALYSASSTAQPYIYPFGQYAPSSAPNNNYNYNNNNNNQIYRDQATYGQTYSLFDQSLSGNTGYQSASDLKTTTLRDQPPPATLSLRGTGPLPGPVLSNTGSFTSANNQMLRDQPSSTYYYSNSGATTNSRFFDVAGNNSVMYYPYRTTTNYNTGSSSQVFRDTTNSQMLTTDKCSLNDPYWCSDYVNIYLDSKRNFENASVQSSCQQLVQSLLASYNGCCQTVRAAGCPTTTN